MYCTYLWKYNSSKNTLKSLKILTFMVTMNECKRLTTIKLCFYPVILFCFLIFIHIFYNIEKAPYFCF